MSNIPKFIYDEEKTRQYISRELKKIALEKEKVMSEYNGLIDELKKYNRKISIMSSNYKDVYQKVVDAGTIGSLSITDSEKLLDASQNIDDLMVSVDDLITQIEELIVKYNQEYSENVIRIKNHREYTVVNEMEELE